MDQLYRKGFRAQNNEIAKQEFSVIGNIPNWLNGNLYRNGPGKFQYGETPVNHIFDGPAMIHQFTFDHGQVFYQNKFLQTAIYKESEKAGKITAQEYSTDYRTLLQKMMGLLGKKPKISDNANVNVMKVRKELIAITSSPSNIHFDKDTLETYGTYKFDDNYEFYGTPHPSIDPLTGDTYDIASVISSKPAYVFYKIPSGKNVREIIATIPTRKLGYIHSFATTQNYVLLIEYPYFLNLFKLGIAQKTYSESLDWQPSKGMNFIIVNKYSGEITKIHSQDVFTFYHISNSFEKNGFIYIDIPVFSEPNEKSLVLQSVLHDGQNLTTYNGFYRFSVDLKTHVIVKEKLSDYFIELERINYENYNDRDYRFTYGMSQLPTSIFFDRLIKIDVKNKVTRFWHEENTVPGEPVFVPNPRGTEEDDGVLLSVILDGESERSFLLVLNAKNMEELASICLPQHIPFGFHGQFYFRAIDV